MSGAGGAEAGVGLDGEGGPGGEAVPAWRAERADQAPHRGPWEGDGLALESGLLEDVGQVLGQPRGQRAQRVPAVPP